MFRRPFGNVGLVRRYRRTDRPGLSLMELLVVVTLMGIFAATVSVRFSRDILGDSGVRSDARRLSLALLASQRAAIRSGDRHGVRFQGSTSSATAWSIVQQLDDGSTVVIDGPQPISQEVDLAVSHATIWFDFEGNGSDRFTGNLVGPHRSWKVTVEPLTRMISSLEVTP